MELGILIALRKNAQNLSVYSNSFTSFWDDKREVVTIITETTENEFSLIFGHKVEPSKLLDGLTAPRKKKSRRFISDFEDNFVGWLRKYFPEIKCKVIDSGILVNDIGHHALMSIIENNLSIKAYVAKLY